MNPDGSALKQIVYISTATTAVDAAMVADILAKSRRNNARDGLTGLLYCDGQRFMQALEGASDVLDVCLERIRRDPRHRACVILSCREITAREFGAWAMAHRAAAEDVSDFVDRVRAMVATASPDVRATFEGLAKIRAAA